MEMGAKKRWALWALRLLLALCILGIAAAALRLAMQAYHAAQLAALGVPDLCDPTHISEWLALMVCSVGGMASVAGLMHLDPKSQKRDGRE